MTEGFSGRCLCGAVQFRAAGSPKWVRWCHCESCRRHSGAPASVFVSFENSAVTVTSGEITKFTSRREFERGSARRRGSTLTCSNERLPTETHYYVGAFAEAAELEPKGEFFADERLPWMHP